MSWVSEVTALNPKLWFRHGEASGDEAAEVGGVTLTYSNGPTYGEPGAVGDADTAMAFTDPQFGQSTADHTLWDAGVFAYTVCSWVKCTSTATEIVYRHGGVSGQINITTSFSTVSMFYDLGLSFGSLATPNTFNFADGDWHFIATVRDGSALSIYIDGAVAATGSGAADPMYTGTGTSNVAGGFGVGPWFEGSIDETVIFDKALTVSELDTLYASISPAPTADALPTSFSGQASWPLAPLPTQFKTSTPSSLSAIPTSFQGTLAVGVSPIPMLLNDQDAPSTMLPTSFSGSKSYGLAALPTQFSTDTAYTVAKLPTQFQGPDPNDYEAGDSKWSLVVSLGAGVELSKLVDSVTIETAENESAICTVVFVPPDGVIDPSTFENQLLSVNYLGIDGAGNPTYAVRRFTGITQTAVYDPDDGTMTVDATTDLQGQLENTTREVIQSIIPGSTWSPHIFDDTNDGYQYALDLLSTVPKEIHVTTWGTMVSVDFGAKSTPDITLTDSNRFNNSLTVDRASRRDLLSQYTINFDFRFSRLRHREISVQFPDSYGFCHYLNNNWQLPSKDMVASAADSTAWSRVTEITYIELPEPGVYCTPQRGWVGGAEDFCLGAYWGAARRFAQTVTEQYTLTVKSPDLEANVGRQDINADYGVEATFDSTDFENVTDFDAAPAGFVVSPKSGDYQKEATDAEFDGRAAMEEAQQIAIAVGEVEILKRARTNTVTVECVYNPSMTLEKTVLIDTPHLTAQGKVKRIRETLSPVAGALEMVVELGLSRHNGSGGVTPTPQDPPAKPDQPQEDVSDRTYYIPYRIGGLPGALPEQDDWDGYFTNVQESLAFPGAATYDQKFVVRMPAISEESRNAQVSLAEQVYEIDVPEDILILRY